MASLRKIGTRYFGYFYDPNRNPKRKSVTLRTGQKQVAQKLLRRYENEFAEGIFDPWNPKIRAYGLTLTEASDLFISQKPDIREKTISVYRNNFLGLLKLLPPGILLEHIDASYLKQYIFDRTVSQATRRHRATHLKTLFSWAHDEKLILANPFEKLPIPKRQKKVAEFLTTDQLQHLLNVIGRDVSRKIMLKQVEAGEVAWIKEVIILAVNTGLRRGELISLNWDSVELDTRLVTVRNTAEFTSKSGHERSVPLSGEAVEALFRLRKRWNGDPEDPVFKGLNGKRLSGEYASKRFKYYVRLAELPSRIHFHSLRHTCASWLVMNGVSIPIVQAILGHSDIQVTMRYAHLSPDVLREAVRSTFDG